MQLRCLLDSIECNCPDVFEYYILFKATSDNFMEGYALLQQQRLTPHIYWLHENEKDSHKQFYDFISSVKHYAMFMDDCVFYRELSASASDLLSLFTEDVWCLSLRLGLNTTLQYYVTGQQQASLSGYETIKVGETNFIKWNFKQRSWMENYGFFYGCDGIIYNSKAVLEISERKPFDCIRHFESIMTNQRNASRIKENYMIAPEQSSVFCQSYNCTHPDGQQAFRFYHSLEELNNRFLAGEVIDVDSMDTSHIVSCHEEIPFRFKKL